MPENTLKAPPKKCFVSLNDVILSSCLSFEDKIYYQTSTKIFIPVSNVRKRFIIIALFLCHGREVCRVMETRPYRTSQISILAISELYLYLIIEKYRRALWCLDTLENIKENKRINLIVLKN